MNAQQVSTGVGGNKPACSTALPAQEGVPTVVAAERKGDANDGKGWSQPQSKINEGEMEGRVARLESKMAKALCGITDILSQLSDLKSVVGSGRGLQSHVEGSEKAPTQAKVATSSTLERPHQNIEENEGGNAAGIGDQAPPSNPTEQQGNVAPGVTRAHPIFVADDTSSISVQRNRRFVHAKLTARTPTTQQCNTPCIRALPVQDRLAVGRPSTVKGKDHSSDSTSTAPPHHRYNDPPGYENVDDFGPTPEQKVKVPALQPRKNSVSCSRTPPPMVHST